MPEDTITAPPGSEPEVVDAYATWKYQDGDIVLIPYVNNRTTEVFREEFLVALYLRMKKEKLLETVFCRSKMISLNDFVAALKDASPLIAFHRTGNALNDVVGFMWLPRIEGDPGVRRAELGVVFFREYWGRTMNFVHRGGRLALRYWFHELKVDALFGATLKRNVFAQRYAREMGFTFVAEVPDYLCTSRGLETAVLVSLRRNDFMLSDTSTTVQ